MAFQMVFKHYEIKYMITLEQKAKGIEYVRTRIRSYGTVKGGVK